MIRKVINVGKKYPFILLGVILCSWGCKSLEYKITDQYSGPVIFFIYTDDIENPKLSIDNGLGRISEDMMSREIYFTSTERKTKIHLVPDGQQDSVSDQERYIFQLGVGKSSNSCIDKHLALLTFYIGTKSEYNSWYNLYQDEFEYFDSKGVDWCKYYKEGLK